MIVSLCFISEMTKQLLICCNSDQGKSHGSRGSAKKNPNERGEDSSNVALQDHAPSTKNCLSKQTIRDPLAHPMNNIHSNADRRHWEYHHRLWITTVATLSISKMKTIPIVVAQVQSEFRGRRAMATMMCQVVRIISFHRNKKKKNRPW